ncbi:glycosyltransferase 87 family protein [Rufibacter tibetensis]|uniref:Mannosyltransferase n=1 Tax=Rufibacter tibetensis TaxID=512763 RepID=A0A0P0CTR4_9BACT|nr:glycosyltransferase 87 family protein [Rufibacter tibetensis]ALI97679.1 hypothetical protein DC20_00065 [Rufibacter tibetensis]
MKGGSIATFETQRGLLLFSIVVSFIVIYFLGYMTQRTEFEQLLLWFGAAFIAYFLQIRSKLSLSHGLLLGLVLRLILLFAFPALSNDYFRFFWDGHLLQNGLNPFLTLPSQWMQNGNALPAGLTPELYQSLNSANYYSVYPPVCQFVFWVSTLIKDNILASVVLMRLCLLLAEVGTLWLLPKVLQKLHLPPRQALWYALNPAIILELTGNLHFEAFMIFFLVCALYFFSHGKWRFAAVLIGLSVASKLLPLLLLPLLPRYLGWRKAVGAGLIVAGTLLLLFLPFLSAAFVAHFGSSLNLYFQKFEFNASFYYLLREIGFWLVGFNVISYVGPGLSLLTILFAFWVGFYQKQEQKGITWLATSSLTLLTVYLCFSTTVHPWYISTLVALASCTRFRYPMVWSAMAVLSYATYLSPTYQENLWLVAIEYLVVFGVLGLELKKGQENRKLVSTP